MTKKGKGGKILFLKFIIQQNTDYIDQLSLSEFIDQQPILDNFDIKESRLNQRLNLMSIACNNEFLNTQIQILYNLSNQFLSYNEFSDDMKLFNIFKNKYDEMVMRSQQITIHNRFIYLKALFKSNNI